MVDVTGPDSIFRSLAKRAAETRQAANEAESMGATYRTRSSAVLTSAALLVAVMLRDGLEDDTAYAAVVAHLAELGHNITSEVPEATTTRLARLCLGPDVDRRRVYRVSAAARMIHASGTNSPKEFLREAGGVTRCAAIWGRRAAKPAPRKPDRPILPEGVRAWAEVNGGGRQLAAVVIAPDGSMCVLGVSGPRYALIEVIEDPENFDDVRGRQLRVLEQSATRPLRLLVESNRAVLIGALDRQFRIVAQGDAIETLRPLLPAEATEVSQPSGTLARDEVATGQQW